VIFSLKPFNVHLFKDKVIEIKHITKSNHLAIANIEHCLHSMNYVNKVISIIEKLKSRKVVFTDEKHLELLETLYRQLSPLHNSTSFHHISNETESLPRKDWTELGFQGKDPTTDFRGMGEYSLAQLCYFCLQRPEKARDILKESKHQRRYYPFAATGINFTAFVVELIKENRVHKVLLDLLDRNILTLPYDAESGPSSSDVLLDLGVRELNELYCQIFEEFHDLWLLRDPRDVMEFPKIFQELKERIRSKYPPLVR
jgi:hypothetical protein